LTLISKILSHVASGQCRMGPKKGFTAAFDTEIKTRTFRPSENKGEKEFGRLKFTILHI